MSNNNIDLWWEQYSHLKECNLMYRTFFNICFLTYLDEIFKEYQFKRKIRNSIVSSFQDGLYELHEKKVDDNYHSYLSTILIDAITSVLNETNYSKRRKDKIISEVQNSAKLSNEEYERINNVLKLEILLDLIKSGIIEDKTNLLSEIEESYNNLNNEMINRCYE